MGTVLPARAKAIQTPAKPFPAATGAGLHVRRRRVILAASMNSGSDWTGKRVFDVLLASVGLLVSAPLWAVFAIAIKLEDGGPVFFAQPRSGRLGRVFQALKFRTMAPDAERALGPTYSVPADPRVTRAGRFLRATALDELPQLVNIFLGQMSFVGPRPERPEFVEEFKNELPSYEQRLQILPGLTGLAQIYGHYNSSPRAKLRYDLLYVKRRSFLLDVRLILISFWISLRGRWQMRGRKL